MKLVSINGSPHGATGGTARIAAWVIDACRVGGVRETLFSLSEMKIGRCHGCGRCMNSGECPINDDVAAIHAAWGDADIVLLSSPTHVFHTTDLMKSFIDRTAGFFHRPPFEGTYAAVVTSSAGMGETAVVRYLANCLEILGAAFVGSVGGTYRPPTRLWDPDQVAVRARLLGEELLACVREKRTFPLSDEVVSQRRFLRELIRRNRRIFRADYAYWEERDWFNALPGTLPDKTQPGDQKSSDT